jgi:ribosomal protein L37E
MAIYFAICSSPECSRSTTAPSPDVLPAICAACGAAMVTTCWKCGTAVASAGTSYCSHCGVPLKRVLPRRDATPLVLVCGNAECDWGIAGVSAAAMQTRCPRCGTEVTAECWKCGARIDDPDQHYCAKCGVPLKRDRRPAASGLPQA